MYKRHTQCRACGGGDLVEVFSLGNQPLANDFKTINEEHEGLAPLTILLCPKCTLAQLSVTVDPNLIYSKNYPYVTSSSETMQRHFLSLWGCLRELSPARTVLEIGSNDGKFLKFCGDHGAEHVMGIDPAENLALISNQSGVTTLVGLFDTGTAADAKWTLADKVDVIVARHVFGHVDDWKEFVSNLELVSNDETLVVLEVPWVMDFIENGEFDTCYHEHLSYVSVQSVVALLEGTNFQLHKVVRFPIHGGAIAMMIRRRDWKISPDDKLDESVAEFVWKENITIETWREFSETAYKKIVALGSIVRELVYENKTICGFGASAKSTVMIQACGFTSDHIRFICDCTPNKQGRLSPNTDIPIVSEKALLEKMPDYAIIFCWNFAAEVIEKNSEYLRRGGKFIIPIPELKIIDSIEQKVSTVVDIQPVEAS